MRFEELKALNKIILMTREDGLRHNFVPIINELFPTQQYLIISSDPSSKTNKHRNLLEKHSDFEERILALMFYGSDQAKYITKVRLFYTDYKALFLKNFYWTHFSKVYARGHPGPFWANKFLIQEIELFEPTVMVIFGGIVADFLFGRGKLWERINRVLVWNGIPTICSLHPSRNWNLRRRKEFQFNSTWRLIQKKCQLYPEDLERLQKLKLHL